MLQQKQLGNSCFLFFSSKQCCPSLSKAIFTGASQLKQGREYKREWWPLTPSNGCVCVSAMVFSKSRKYVLLCLKTILTHVQKLLIEFVKLLQFFSHVSLTRQQTYFRGLTVLLLKSFAMNSWCLSCSFFPLHLYVTNKRHLINRCPIP